MPDSLPKGFRATEAASHMVEADVTKLHQQALGQASMFEVLQVKDVESLSKVLYRRKSYL
jgi:hypothetical protein